MARNKKDMVGVLKEMYAERGKRLVLTKDEFKSIAGKELLRDAYLRRIENILWEDGYMLVDLREERDLICVVRISFIANKKCRVPSDLIEQYYWEEAEEEDEEEDDEEEEEEED